jgi:hypothetical protein
VDDNIFKCPPAPSFFVAYTGFGYGLGTSSSTFVGINMGVSNIDGSET